MNKRIRRELDRLPDGVTWSVRQSRDHYWLYIGDNPGVLCGNNSSRDKFAERNIRDVRRVVDQEIRVCSQRQK